MKKFLWWLLFTTLPILILLNLVEYRGETMPKTSMTLILVGIGMLIGTVLFLLTKAKNNIIKVLYLSLTLCLLFGGLIYWDNHQAEQQFALHTCEICGYRSLENLGKECPICLVSINEKARKEGEYHSIQELITEEQKLFFADETDILLQTPSVYKDGDYQYEKDLNWTPKVSPEEIEAERPVIKQLKKEIQKTLN